MGHHYLHLQPLKVKCSNSELRQARDSDLLVQDLTQLRLMNLVGFSEASLFVDSFHFLHPFKNLSNVEPLHDLAVTHIQATVRSDQIKRLLGF